ncbi:4'-phosphopantetheinyl transferase family protein [Candidatus Foliamicus sp.]
MLWRPIRETDEELIVHLNLAPNASREQEALGWLDASELERRSRFVNPQSRRQFTLCRSALRAILCRKLGCDNEDLAFTVSSFGKPLAIVAGEPARIAFNVSHGGRHGLIAMAPGGRIGVDVEERSPDRNLKAYSDLLFTPRERIELERTEGSAKVELFYRLWTIKEALVKAAGDGLSMDTAGFEIPPALIRGDTTAEFSFPETPSIRWRIENIGNEQFAAAVARELD